MEEVVIIGAGACGLMAARELLGKKRNITVIEARDRSGGRIHTLYTQFSCPVEAGAEFMHGSQPLTRALIDASGSDTTLLGGNRYQLHNGALKKGDTFDHQWDALIRSLGKLDRDLQRNFSGQQYNQLRENVEHFVEGFDAADSHQASALALLQEWSQNDDEHQYHIIEGYSRLTCYLEEQATLHGARFLFSHPVKEIRWRPGHVSVLTAPGKTVEASKAVITIPLGLLQKGSIIFSPPLPQQTEAVREMGYGGVIKFFFQFSEPFWERSTTGIHAFSFIFSDATIPTWWSQMPDPTPLLTGWLGGPATYRIDHNEEFLYAKAVDSLSYIFNARVGEVKEKITQWRIEDWVKDPWALGAYGYPTVRGRHAVRFLKEPVRDTLYFAGEALYDGAAPGTVEAALVSGKEVAEKAVGDWL